MYDLISNQISTLTFPTEVFLADGDILNTIAEEKWLDAWQASDHQLNYILTALNYSNLYDLSKVTQPGKPCGKVSA